MAEIKFLDKAGLTQVISHLQQDTDEKIAQAIEDAIFAGDSDENVDNLPYLDAEKLNGYTSDDFVKVADLGTTTVGLATADAEGNIISSTYAKNSDMNSGFVSLQSQIDNKVDKTTTVNGKALSSNIAITAADVGADAQGTAANALKEAKTYAEGQASSALTSAKTYTDTETTSTYSAAKTYAEEQAASALKSAKTYADTASATALSDAKEYNDTAYANANAYTDKKIADLINGAPTTLDTLGEIATAMNNNADVVEALNEAIGTKANSADLANYLSKSGGDVSGNVYGRTNTANASIRFGVSNPNRAVELLAGSSLSGVYFSKFSKWGLQCEDNGNVTVNGTATGNLPLSGGTLTVGSQTLTVKSEHNEPLDLNNAVSGAESVFTGYYLSGTLKGKIGFRGTTPKIVANGSETEILHSGNIGSYALPKSGGGTVTKVGRDVINVNRDNASADSVTIGYRLNGTVLGEIGASNNQGAIYRQTDGTVNTLLHTGNVGDYALPISGGTMKGHIKLPTGRTITNNNDRAILEYRGSDSDGSGTRVGDYNDRMVLLTSGDDLWHYNRTVGKDGLVLDTLNYSDYALPRTGGTIESNAAIPFTIKTTNSALTEVYQDFYAGSTRLGGLGYYGANNPVALIGEAAFPLLHTGMAAKVATSGSYNDLLNKPTSLPASDVYSWAKAASKPSYTASEVGAAPSSHTHDDRYYTETEVNNLLAGKTNIISFASKSDVVNYTAFARMSSSNQSGNGHASFIVSGAGNFGGYSQGIWFVTISNRSSIPTMKVTTLSPHDSGTVVFGYYTSGSYFYFGVYASNYRGTLSVTTLQNADASVGSYYDSATAPSGWTSVTPSTFLSSGGGTISGNLKFSSALPENTSPTVVATFGSNNSANGFSFTSTSNLSVNYATSSGYAGSAGGANFSNQLQAFTGDNFSGGNHYVKAIRGDGWTTRLVMCYDGGATQADAVCVNYSNSSGYASSAGTISNQGSAATKDIVHTTTDPGAGAASSYKEGSIICVYE